MIAVSLVLIVLITLFGAWYMDDCGRRRSRRHKVAADSAMARVEMEIINSLWPQEHVSWADITNTPV